MPVLQFHMWTLQLNCLSWFQLANTLVCMSNSSIIASNNTMRIHIDIQVCMLKANFKSKWFKVILLTVSWCAVSAIACDYADRNHLVNHTLQIYYCRWWHHSDRRRSVHAFGLAEACNSTLESSRTCSWVPGPWTYHYRAHTTAYSRRTHWLFQRDAESVVKVGPSQPFLADPWSFNWHLPFREVGMKDLQSNSVKRFCRRKVLTVCMIACVS